METFYHGTTRLFKKFHMSHAFEGDGKCKFGFGAYVTEVFTSAAHYAFATNLKIAGVEELYIKESMGHALGGDVTVGYQDLYPLEIRFRNNSKLLNLEKKEEPIDIDSLSPEQMKELLKKMMGQS